MRFLKWFSNNILFIFTIFLLAFIPLYPKIPLLDIQHTWVYVRLEDFVIVFTVLLWIILLLHKKITLKTPLTIPILIFWLIGGIATVHGVLIIFPSIANVFSNVALLSFLRRIEYISLFFVAYASIKDKRHIVYAALFLATTLFLIVGYGFGQKFLGFPAFLTMNEEVAKGVPVYLSQLSRIPSTFAGHYDLAAYLVLVIPIMVSLFFGFKRIAFKILFFTVSVLGFILLFMTVSRVSFVVLLIALLALLILQRKKIVVAALLIITFILLVSFPTLLDRFNNTVSEVDVLVNARTGNAIGEVKEVPAEYFKDKIVKKVPISNEEASIATGSAIVPFEEIPAIAPLVIEANVSTGENLPQGTGYVNLPLSPLSKKVGGYFFQKPVNNNGVESEEIMAYYGNYLIKKAKAYDLSFTTRFQGEWPNTFNAFKRNIFLGSGYGSVSLAVDNDYLRILGESGMLGFFSFISIFIIGAIYIKKILPRVDSPVVKSFVLGFVAGSLGLVINASLIDVFEASKVAFSYWILTGVVIGTLHLYEKEKINLIEEFRKAVISPIAIVIYISVIACALFFPLYSNYFVADDFTWLRWAANWDNNILDLFTKASGFFYRPGTKLYFSLMYSTFWLNQSIYHIVSILLHLGSGILIFLLSKKIVKNYSLSVFSAVLFLTLSMHHEMVFWISCTGHLLNAFFSLAALLLFINYREKGKNIYLVISLIFIIFSLLFHELGVIVPLLLILYDAIFVRETVLSKASRKVMYLILLSPLVPYAILRLLARSHWLNGDYSYNLLKLPLNALGNTFGYILLNLMGPQSIPLYEKIRIFLRGHMFVAAGLFVIIALALLFLYKLFRKKVEEKNQKVIIFSILFFLIALLPFLGLGNISPRYGYLSSFGFVIILGLIFKKAYDYLARASDKYIALMCISILAIVFFMIHSFALQKLYTDWKSAGDKARNLLVSIEENSSPNWITQNTQFYFVNPPIKKGDAWVWPVGLDDALWFVFENPNLSTHIMSDVNLALNQARGSSNGHVFVFDSNGNVNEVSRNRNGKVIFLSPLR